MKLIYNTTFLLAFFFLNAQNLQIDYNVTMSKKFSTEGLKEFEKMDKESRKYFLKANQASQKSLYKSFLTKNLSVLEYQEVIDNSQEKSQYSYKSAPFGFDRSVRRENDSLVLTETKNFKNTWAKIPLTNIDWEDVGKDSLILGYKVKKSIGLDKISGFEYHVWYAPNLPKNIGIYNLKHPKGYVLAFKAYGKNLNPKIELITLEALPKKIEKLTKKEKKKIANLNEQLTEAKILSMKEIQEMYKELNQKRNEAQSSGIDN